MRYVDSRGREWVLRDELPETQERVFWNLLRAITNAKDDGEIQKSIDENAEYILRTVLGLVKLHYSNNSPARDNFHIYRMSITEFSRECGYEEADSDELEKISDSLDVLDKLYVIFWEPENGGAKKSKKPNARPQMVKVARRLLMIDAFWGNYEDYSEDKEFRVAAVAFDLRGGETSITLNTLLAEIFGAKKIPKYRFFCQLLAETNIKEEDLLDKVFGYSARLEEAKYNQDAYEYVKGNILRHKSRDKDRIRRWAAKYVEEGILGGFELHKNPQGEIVLTWRKGDATAEQIEERKRKLDPDN